MNNEATAVGRETCLLQSRARRTGSWQIFLNKANLSSLAVHISKEEEMEILINIIKSWKD